MLVSFALENWMSFKDPIKLSLVESDCSRKDRIIPKIGQYNSGLLPIIAIYGGNASGKSNLVKALQFTQNLVIHGMLSNTEINAKPFKLNETSMSQPCNFNFQLLIDEILYDYAFSVCRDGIRSESLYKIPAKSDPFLQFEREKQEFKFGEEFNTDSIKNVASTTSERQLFLCHSTFFNLDCFRHVYDWFDHSLLVVGSNSELVAIDSLLDSESPLIKRINNTLFQLDTGVISINKQALSTEYLNALLANEIISISKLMEKKIISADLPDGKISVRLNDDELIGHRLITQHRMDSGQLTDFNFNDESDGTKRLIELIPAFFGLTQKTKLEVLVIDELDRSLHSRLTKNLIEKYLDNCDVNSRTQLIFTTHDQSLISELSLCNDEVCLTDRDNSGKSNLVAFSDFKDMNSDGDIQEIYNMGIAGGLPKIIFENTKINPFDNVDVKEEYIL